MPIEPSRSPETLLKTDLLLFYDNFVEFHDYCSFMCDAFASLALGEDGLDTSTAMGACRFCHWIKHPIQKLKEDLKQIHEMAGMWQA